MLTQVVTWNGVQLTQPQRSRRKQQAHKYVTESHRSYEAVKTLINFIDCRLEATELMSTVPVVFNPQHWRNRLLEEDFTETYGSAELSSLHDGYMPDLNKTSLMSECMLLKATVRSRYSTGAGIAQNVDRSMLLKLAILLKMTTFPEAAPRVLCPFPHSMHVEQLVSSHMRASMSQGTLNDYLIVKESMSALSTFDPRPSIARWLTERHRQPKTSESADKVQNYLTNDCV